MFNPRIVSHEMDWRNITDILLDAHFGVQGTRMVSLKHLPATLIEAKHGRSSFSPHIWFDKNLCCDPRGWSWDEGGHIS